MMLQEQSDDNENSRARQIPADENGPHIEDQSEKHFEEVKIQQISRLIKRPEIDLHLNLHRIPGYQDHSYLQRQQIFGK